MKSSSQQSAVSSPKLKIQDAGYKMQDSAKKKFWICIFTLIAVSCQLSAAFASGGGEEGASAILKDYLWKIINFGILFFILYKFGKKPLQSFLKQRTELIEKNLKEAKEAKELAQKALAAVEERLKARDREIEEIVSSAKESGEKEKARLIEEGSRMKEKILEQARTNIAYEVKRAKETIMEEAAAIAIELAEKKLKEKLTQEEQLKLLEDSLAKIEGKN